MMYVPSCCMKFAVKVVACLRRAPMYKRMYVLISVQSVDRVHSHMQVVILKRVPARDSSSEDPTHMTNELIMTAAHRVHPRIDVELLPDCCERVTGCRLVRGRA